MNVSFLQELLNTVAEQGRNLIPWTLKSTDPAADIRGLTEALVSVRGEASGVALARQLLECYLALDDPQRLAFFGYVARELRPDPNAIRLAAERYLAAPEDGRLADLQHAVESPRQEFFRRLNLASGATGRIVAMRRDLLRHSRGDASLAAVDSDMRHLLSSWFNRGFLVLRRIDWQTPAAILEKIIAYEAVHEIRGWDDLRRRLDPVDRRCFAFFHPALVDEPLIFVEVALTRAVPASISQLIGDGAKRAHEAAHDPTTAVFYSISNCQEGLKGISFGNFLIKQVVEDLAREMPTLRTFVTLSPVPQFARWLQKAQHGAAAAALTAAERISLRRLASKGWHAAPDAADLEAPLLALAASYFLASKDPDQRPIDPVARFHLGNGARLDRINWLGDTSDKGLSEAHGLMVNYRYDLKEIERNHEGYANDGAIAASKSVRSLLRPPPKGAGTPVKALAPPGDDAATAVAVASDTER